MVLKSLFYFCILFVFICCSGIKEDKSHLYMHQSPEFMSVRGKSIMFYNVENLFDIKDDHATHDDDYTPQGYKQWTAQNFKEKTRNIAKVIKGIDENLPFIIGLAEVENKTVLEALSNEKVLKNAHYKIVHENSKDERGVDVALLYNPTYFDYESHEALSFYFDLPNGRKDYTRDILYVKGKVEGTETLHLFVNHWSSRREGKKKSEFKRMKAASILYHKIEAIRENDPWAKIIIMGDFNDEPYNKSIEQTLGASDGESKNKLFNLHYKFYRSQKGTINYQNKWMQFDQMIVSNSFINSSKGISVQKDSGKNFNEQWIMYRNNKGILKPNKSYSGPKYHGGYSDHLPVYITLDK